jgi:hypothetical protein
VDLRAGAPGEAALGAALARAVDLWNYVLAGIIFASKMFTLKLPENARSDCIG